MADSSLYGLLRAFGGQALDAAHGASRGISADLLGGPVDLTALGLRALGLNIPPQPVGGSEWIGSKLEGAGLLRPRTGSGPERLGEVTGGLLATPQTVGKVGMAAEQGVKSLGMAAGQKIDDAMMGQGGLLGTALKPSQPYSLTVYHGSPHQFDKFDSSRIGTGEGAQAYGHGLYLAENPGVARSYLRSKDPSEQLVLNMFQNRKIAGLSDDIAKQQTIEWATKNPQIGKDIAERAFKNSSLYKVDLPDEHIAKMLDWDKPLNQQSEHVSRALKSILKDTDRMPAEWIASSPGAEARMREVGIPGIKYLDAGSRGAEGGTRNFVVFDDKILKILERNGGLLGVE